MLSKETIDIVKSTIPMLQDKGLPITSTFYETLFTEAPDLKHVFNLANQRDSSQSQALAEAILAYAGNLDSLETLLPAVSRIANKHASLGVLPEHYSIVGDCLLRTIQTVADLPDNHPALIAWGEAYELLASVFISSEEALYANSKRASGGWEGFREFVVEAITSETTNVKSLILAPADGQDILSFAGGQYISIKMEESLDGFDQIRQYSLSDWSEAPNQYRITTKKEDLGNVSSHIHDLSQGDTVLVSAPYGQFTLNEHTNEHVFIAAGVGITPLFSMLQQATQEHNTTPVTLINCMRDAHHQIFNEQIAALESSITLKRAFEFDDSGDFAGRLNKEILSEWLTNKTADIYFCGPQPFLKSLKQILNEIGFDDAQLHYEVFGPTTAL